MSEAKKEHSRVPQRTVDTKLQLESRGYQLEMFYLSCKQNIIVAMGTGTGKTKIALLRIAEEIRSGCQDKLIWLLCPTVALCAQHLASMNQHIPLGLSRSFTSKDNVESWRDQKIWDTALSGICVAISTYQVLLDALVCGFVRIDRLSLLIYDEAHNCTKNHAANRIMQHFYYPQKSEDEARVPRILGLSASPVISKPSQLSAIEKNLDSICKSPTHHYKQLLDFTNSPSIHIEQYSQATPSTDPDMLTDLRGLIDSSMGEVKSGNGMEHIHDFLSASAMVNAQLGGWAATQYMTRSIKQFKKRMRTNAEWQSVTNRKKDTAMEFICRLGQLGPEDTLSEASQLSPKCLCLLRKLSELYSKEFCGLIFVQQKSTVYALQAVLENHPETKDRFRCGTFVGMSSVWFTSKIGDFHNAQRQSETLYRFRMGYLNLIITTDALEEGIDVPACNTVINFDRPSNLKSFIQRRGRARQRGSVFVNIIGESRKELDALQGFIEGERKLIEVYRSNERHKEWLEERNQKYNSTFLSFRVETTKAQITMLESVSYLNKFCSTLPSKSYATNRPVFIYRCNYIGLVQATVRLPSCLDPSLHEITGSKWWSKKSFAKQDAALQAYIALFNAHLVNENLVPSRPADILGQKFGSHSYYDIPAQYDPWVDAAELWNSNSGLFVSEVKISRPGDPDTTLAMVMSIQIAFEIQIPLYIKPGLTYTVTISPGKPNVIQDVSAARRITHLILASVFQSRPPPKKYDFINLFVPNTDPAAMELFLSNYSGTLSLATAVRNGVSVSSMGLLRGINNRGAIKRLLPGNYGCPPGGDPTASLTEANTGPFPWRRNFLRAFDTPNPSPVGASTPAGHLVTGRPLVLEEFDVERLPFQFSEASILIPSINHEVGDYLVAESLHRQFFPQVPFRRMDLLATAVRPSCTESMAQFQAMAFLGDSMVQLAIAKQLFLHHPLWHEGLLSKLRDIIVSDSGLAQAAVECGLARFLVTKRFRARGWRPTFVSNLAFGHPGSLDRRRIGSSTLADMIKALVGAAYIASGLDEALQCAASIIPKFKSWHGTSLHDGDYIETRPRGITVSREWAQLESVLDYSYHDKSLLLEAMTHPSYLGPSQTTCYRRLSFLGSSVLHMVVVDHLHRRCGKMTPHRLQSLKAAVTNNKILAYLCLNLKLELEQKDVDSSDPTNINTVVRQYSLQIRDFLLIHSDELRHQLSTTVSSTSTVSTVIRDALYTSERYPWVELTELALPAVLSDVVQSIFGSIYVDSKARLPDCNRFAERIGIIPILNAMIERDIVPDHPRDVLRSLCPGKRISYHVQKLDAPKPIFRCSVLVNNNQIVAVEGAKGVRAVIVRAAQAAVYHVENMVPS